MRKILPDNRIIWIVAIIAAILIPVFAKYRDMRKTSSEITSRAIQVINENYFVYEPNPTYADETNNLNKLFRYVLNNRNKIDPTERKNILSKSMSFYGENDETESAIEDAVDQNRLMMRESITMAIAALVSEPNEAKKYFERAKESLNEGEKTSDRMEDTYSALLVLEGLYLSEHQMFNAADKIAMINTVNNFGNLSSKSKDSFIGVLQELR
jgi:ribonucleotide reductase alpha subunit